MFEVNLSLRYPSHDGELLLANRILKMDFAPFVGLRIILGVGTTGRLVFTVEHIEYDALYHIFTCYETAPTSIHLHNSLATKLSQDGWAVQMIRRQS
jgi:hypothetical protein